MGEDADPTWLILLVAGALLCGLFVLYLKPDYRFDEIIRSNQDYYPAIKATPPGDESTNEDREEESR